MTLNANEPTDQRMVEELPAYMREARAAINSLVAGTGFGTTVLSVTGGTTSLSVGADLGTYGIELVVISGAGAATIATILGGTQGQIKIFIFQDGNLNFTDSSTKLNGTFYLNQLPAGSNFSPDADDIVAIVNIGGDGASTYGYWKELFRTLTVK